MEKHMTALVAGDVYRVVVGTFTRQQLGLNVLHYEVAAVAGAVSDQDMTNSLDVTGSVLYQAMLGAASTYWGIKSTRVFPLPSPIPVVTSANNGIGVASGDTMSLQTCGIITKLTNLLGRANRGRMYIPFPTEVYNDGNALVTAAYQTLATALANWFLAPQTFIYGIASVTIIPVLWHYATHVWVPITGYRVRGIWGSQHRRSDYGRQNTVPPW
jgi:hypothetical protein